MNRYRNEKGWEITLVRIETRHRRQVAVYRSAEYSYDCEMDLGTFYRNFKRVPEVADER